MVFRELPMGMSRYPGRCRDQPGEGAQRGNARILDLASGARIDDCGLLDTGAPNVRAIGFRATDDRKAIVRADGPGPTIDSSSHRPSSDDHAATPKGPKRSREIRHAAPVPD